ncbi:BCMA, TALL-1 binding domain-containing protein [Rhizoctonia solani AG-1 IA]|uniref:BCMA, TALL-1 binding domain-containing protein n=1 Tax=Thanatephorus cucumeris (strain AG1-IA) TaxID=983506 RepID=L8WZ76_THACA|nr:BCMA, TALL-1 binding domain-containing protein [Rhizoctonia solani AG-1 IA]
MKQFEWFGSDPVALAYSTKNSRSNHNLLHACRPMTIRPSFNNSPPFFVICKQIRSPQCFYCEALLVSYGRTSILRYSVLANVWPYAMATKNQHISL